MHSETDFVVSSETPPIYVAPTPIEETERVAALYALQILDTNPDERFDRIVRLAQLYFRMPVVRVSFVDDDRTWFKSCVGLNVQQAPRAISICSHTILADAPLVAQDLLEHPVFRSSPQVIGKPHFRFYAGAPIILEDGFRVGSVCIMDYEPRPDFGADDVAYLSDLAAIVVHELELHRQIAEGQRELAAAEAEVSRAQAAKRRFLAIVSHELRTPLNTISGFNSLVQSRLSALGEESTVEYVRYVDEAASHLSRQVERILTFSAAQSPKLELEETEFPIQSLLSRCIELISFQGGSSVEFERQFQFAPEMVFADQSHITQIVTELAENAASFVRPGGKALVEAKQVNGGDLCVRFVNDGEGFPEDEITRVMDAFAQGDEELSRAHNGFGLGLPIARALARLHGGDVSIRNLPDGGAETAFTLPAHRVRGVVAALTS
jgi:signal transduction histidine kinase